MRAPIDTIEAPRFLPHLRWANVKRLRMEQLRGQPVLVEFWDFCRPNSLRTLPYVKAWHERYGWPPAAPAAAARGPKGGHDHDRDRNHAPAGDGREQKERHVAGLQVVGIHSPGFEPGRDRRTVLAAVARLGVEYPVMIDSKLEMWQEYENLGWPARYLFGPDGMLFDYHYGEGAYAQTELAIQELLGLDDPPPPLPPLRPEDAPDAVLAQQTEDQAGAYQGAYEAGAVWAVLDGSSGLVEVNGGERAGGVTLTVEHPGAYPLVEHPRHTAGELRIALTGDVRCLATCFTPGTA